MAGKVPTKFDAMPDIRANLSVLGQQTGTLHQLSDCIRRPRINRLGCQCWRLGRIDALPIRALEIGAAVELRVLASLLDTAPESGWRLWRANFVRLGRLLPPLVYRALELE